jgi:hypothetical protein
VVHLVLFQLIKNAIVFVRCWRHDFRLLKSNLELRVNARVGYWILRYESYSVRPAEEVADDGAMDFKAAASLCFYMAASCGSV